MESTTRKTNHYYLTALAVLVALAMAVGSLAGEAGSAQAAFPGANGKIAFESYRNGNDEIYVMNANGSNQTNLTKHAARNLAATFSPDGTKIAFTSNRSGNWEVYTMNALDGSTQQNRSNNGAADVDSDRGVASP